MTLSSQGMLLGLVVARARNADSEGTRAAALAGAAFGQSTAGMLLAARLAERSADPPPRTDTDTVNKGSRDGTVDGGGDLDVDPGRTRQAAIAETAGSVKAAAEAVTGAANAVSSLARKHEELLKGPSQQNQRQTGQAAPAPPPPPAARNADASSADTASSSKKAK